MITIVTIPLGFTRARMLSVTPVLTLEIVLANRELPPICAPPASWNFSLLLLEPPLPLGTAPGTEEF